MSLREIVSLTDTARQMGSAGNSPSMSLLMAHLIYGHVARRPSSESRWQQCACIAAAGWVPWQQWRGRSGMAFSTAQFHQVLQNGLLIRLYGADRDLAVVK